MGFPLFLVAVFLLRTAGSQEVNLRKGNDSFYLSANDELSAAALNVRVNFQPYDETWNAFKAAFGKIRVTPVEGGGVTEIALSVHLTVLSVCLSVSLSLSILLYTSCSFFSFLARQTA